MSLFLFLPLLLCLFEGASAGILQELVVGADMLEKFTEKLLHPFNYDEHTIYANWHNSWKAEKTVVYPDGAAETLLANALQTDIDELSTNEEPKRKVGTLNNPLKPNDRQKYKLLLFSQVVYYVEKVVKPLLPLLQARGAIKEKQHKTLLQLLLPETEYDMNSTEARFVLMGLVAKYSKFWKNDEEEKEGIEGEDEDDEDEKIGKNQMVDSNLKVPYKLRRYINNTWQLYWPKPYPKVDRESLDGIVKALTSYKEPWAEQWGDLNFLRKSLDLSSESRVLILLERLRDDAVGMELNQTYHQQLDTEYGSSWVLGCELVSDLATLASSLRKSQVERKEELAQRAEADYHRIVFAVMALFAKKQLKKAESHLKKNDDENEEQKARLRVLSKLSTLNELLQTGGRKKEAWDNLWKDDKDTNPRKIVESRLAPDQQP